MWVGLHSTHSGAVGFNQPLRRDLRTAAHAPLGGNDRVPWIPSSLSPVWGRLLLLTLSHVLGLQVGTWGTAWKGSCALVPTALRREHRARFPTMGRGGTGAVSWSSDRVGQPPEGGTLVLKMLQKLPGRGRTSRLSPGICNRGWPMSDWPEQPPSKKKGLEHLPSPEDFRAEPAVPAVEGIVPSSVGRTGRRPRGSLLGDKVSKEEEPQVPYLGLNFKLFGVLYIRLHILIM